MKKGTSSDWDAGGRVELSLRQRQLVRIALRTVRNRGNGTPNSQEWSWTTLAREIDRYTSLTDRDDENPESTNDLEAELADKEAEALIEVYSERLRRFVEGEPKGSGNFPFPKEPVRSCMIEYLMHPEVGLLTKEALMAPEIDSRSAVVFAEFVWQRSAGNDKETRCVEGCFVAVRDLNGRRVEHRLELSSSGHPFFVFARETVTDILSSSTMERGQGWAVFSPISEVMIFIVKQGSEEVKTHTGHLNPGAEELNGVQVLLGSLPFSRLPSDALGLAQGYINENYPLGSSSPRQFSEAWAKAEEENIIFFRYLGSDTGISSPTYGNMKEEKRTPRWGSRRFSRPATQTDESSMEDMDKSKSTKDKFNPPDLILAIKNCDIDGFRRLVESGSDVNCREAVTLLTPLHYIAILGRDAEFEVLKTRPDLNYLVRDHKGRLPSYHAGMTGDNEDMFDELLKAELKEEARTGVSASLLGDPPPEQSID